MTSADGSRGVTARLANRDVLACATTSNCRSTDGAVLAFAAGGPSRTARARRLRGGGVGRCAELEH